MVYKFFDEKFTSLANKLVWREAIKIKNILKQQLTTDLAEELHKLIIKNFEEHKVYSFSKDNVWCADFSDMELIGRFNKKI